MGVVHKLCRKGKNLILTMLCVYGLYSLLVLLYLNAISARSEDLSKQSLALSKKDVGQDPGNVVLDALGNLSDNSLASSLDQKSLTFAAATAGKVEPKKTESKAVAPKKDDPKKAESKKEEPKKVDSKKEEPKKPASKKEEPKKADSKKEEHKRAWKPVPFEDEYNEFLSPECMCPPRDKPHEYALMITSDLCSRDTPYLVTFVHTALNHRNRRDVIRRTWGSVKTWEGRPVVTVFMLGASLKEADNTAAMKESEEHGDIVQGDFIDSYHNMTYKHVMGLGWVADNCPSARYVFKADDDPLVNIFDLFKLLDKSPIEDDVIRCHILPKAHPQRGSTKWRTSYRDYYLPEFPSYCEGLGFLTTLSTARRLFQAAASSRYFWVDDVYVSGLLRVKAKISLEGFNRGVFTPNLVQPQHQQELMKYFIYRGINLPVNLYDQAWEFISSHYNYTRG